MTLIIFYIALLAWITQIVYLVYISVWPKTIQEPLTGTHKEVTIVISAKNEAKNLEQLLPLLIRQAYPTYKILIINDGSTDRTADVVQYWQERFPDSIQLFSLLQKDIAGKKGAIYEALPHIHSDYIIFTDADCRPASAHWLHLMMAAFQKGEVNIVLGYSPVSKGKGMTHLIQSWHNAWTAWQYLGAAFQGKPYMSVGRNWGVATRFYRKYQNILTHQHILSGDDDLVFQSLVKKGRVATQVSPQAWMWTKACPDFQAFFRQQLRHTEAGLRYPVKDQIRLSLFPISVLTSLICIFYLIIQLPLVGLSMLLFLFLSWMLPARSILARLGQNSLFWKLPFLMPVELFLQGCIFLLTLLGMKGRWK